MLIIGIDPGLSGALSFIDHRGLRALVDIPIMSRGGKGFVKNQINAAALSEALKEPIHSDGYSKNDTVVFIELVNAMSGQGRSSIASLGMSAGIIEGVVCALGYPHKYVTPGFWKKHFKLDRDKEHARALAQRFYPEADIHKKKDHNRAESLLIARYGYEVTA